MPTLARILSDIDAQIDRPPTFARRLAILVFHPGFHVIFRARLAARCMRIAPLWPLGKCLWYLNAVLNGCYISHRAIIGSRLRLPHPIGVVIGDGVVIRDSVTIYQNVTIGRSNASDTAYPSIGNGTILYAGAVVVGGISVGQHCIVGANVVVSKSILDDSLIRLPRISPQVII